MRNEDDTCEVLKCVFTQQLRIRLSQKRDRGVIRLRNSTFDCMAAFFNKTTGSRKFQK
jgi:hypothetical protein